MYCGKLDSYDTHELIQLIVVADKYSVRSLVSFCGYRITCNLSTDNAVDILIIADLVKEHFKKKYCMDFIIANKDEIVKSQSFKNMVKTHAYSLAELFCQIKCT